MIELTMEKIIIETLFGDNFDDGVVGADGVLT